MTPDPLDRVTRMLQHAAADTGDVEALPPGRDAAVARLADAIRARARLQKRKRALGMMAVAAGLVVVAGGAVAMARHAGGPVASAPDLGRVVDPIGGVTVLRDGRSEAVPQGSRVAEGTELRTSPSSEAHLDFDSGTRVTLGGSARVRLVEQSQRKRFSLEAGSLFAKVAKLTADERFVVATPDSEVEVRGTAFRVSIVPANPACEDGTPTRLEVSEGVVVVRHAGVEHRVAAGQRWPVCDERPAAKAPSQAAAFGAAPTASPVRVAATAAGDGTTGSGMTLGNSVTEASAMAAGTAGGASPVSAGNAASARAGASRPESAGSSPEASSRLAEQNDLFDDAMRLKRGGDPTGAITKLDRLLAVYPGGPLSESAAVERMRLLASSDRTRATAAARDYLRRHPRGFARTEAEAIVSGGP